MEANLTENNLHDKPSKNSPSNEKIKFLLISPTSPLWRIGKNQKPSNSKVFRFSMLPSLCVAASMPANVETRILDEDVEPIDFDTDADLIGVTFMTYNAPRAYEIGDRFRAKGKTVFFGGYHPSFMPEEAIQHADALCIGEAENNVPQMVNDYLKGNLKKIYRNELLDLQNLPILNRNLLRKNAYVTTNVLQATRGCYHRCGFCSVAAFNRYQIRTRPVGKVIDEMKTLGRDMLFMDDNITLDKDYAKELFKAMAPLNKRWYSQCGLGIVEDDELLNLAAKSGCKGLFLGFESLSQKSLGAYKKHCNRKKDYLEVSRKVHDKGIGIFAGFVFGSDEEEVDVFENTLEFLLEANIEVLQSTRLTPFPGTPLFDSLDKEGRIIDKDWSHYDFFNVVHKPLLMTPEELDKGTAWLQKQFYCGKNIAKRIWRASSYLSTGLIFKIVLPLNLGFRHKLSSYGAFKMGSSFSDVLLSKNSSLSQAYQ